jgi:EAL domain-containing protein (putative c-di-GMP-specific phosphodiesterase class I)
VPALPPATIESLGNQLREILPTRRLHSVSLWDHEATVLWLSEGALGPDEHSLVVEALEVLNADISMQCHERAVEDVGLALFLPVRAPTGSLVGIAMILADSKSVGDDTLERVTAPAVRAIMRRLAVLLKPSDARPAPLNGTVSGAKESTAQAAAAPAPKSPAVISAKQIDDILEFELTPEDTLQDISIPVVKPARAATSETSTEMVSLEFVTDPEVAPLARPEEALKAPTVAAAPAPPAVGAAPATKTHREAPMPEPQPAAALAPAPAQAVASPVATSDPNLLLEILPFVKLRAGGQSRRFQLLARVSPPHRDPASQDALVLQRVMSWLAAHRGAWNSQPTSFTINLSIATLEDERFVQKIAAALNSHGIAAETLGFEIAEALCTQRRAQVERFMTQCEKAGCWVVVDDFSFDSAVLPLLRSRATRLVKIDAKLTSSALKDKLSQALVVATVQAAKVLGIHCAAKKVDSQAALQWLTAIGCDFAQGAALGSVRSLDSLTSSPDPTGLTAMLRSD